MSTGVRERKRLETRRAIVGAATRLYLEKGVARTSVDEIAAAAGIARRTFFLYFASKEDVLFHYLEDHVRRATDIVEDLPPGADAWAGVHAVMSQLVRLFDDPGTRADELADLRAGLVTTTHGLPASLVARLQATQATLLTALRERFPDPAVRLTMPAHLGACMGAAAAAALAVERPEERAAAIRDAVDRASAGFRAP